MGLSVRMWVFGEGEPKRFPYTDYNKVMLARYESSRRFPEYAGKRVKVAVVYFDGENRLPKRVFEISCTYLDFTPEGRMDQAKWDVSMHERSLAVMEGMYGRKGDVVGDLMSQIRGPKCRDKHNWKPTPDEAAALRRIISESIGNMRRS